MINICFAGLTGWTAPPILAAIDAADDLTLTSGVSRSAAGQGAIYATAAEALAAAPADVLVDFTSAAAVRVNAWTAVEAGVHVVIGTSGLTADDYADLDRLATLGLCVGDRLVDPGQVLINDSACSEIEVANLRIANLPLWQANVLSARA